MTQCVENHETTFELRSMGVARRVVAVDEISVRSTRPVRFDAATCVELAGARR
jgi:hypothetical protein